MPLRLVIITAKANLVFLVPYAKFPILPCVLRSRRVIQDTTTSFSHGMYKEYDEALCLAQEVAARCVVIGVL